MAGARDELQREAHGDNHLSNSAKEKLKQSIGRIERLDEEKQAIADDIKDLYSELKALGFDAKAVREIVSERKKKAKLGQKFDELEDMKDLYRIAMGMV